MRTRIWEDAAAMDIVSVLGFLLNDDGEVVGPERTQVLCKLMPSIHTLTHRAILAMLIAGLNTADVQTFYAENGLQVLNAWLLQGIRKPPANVSREKLRIEMYSQVRALLHVLDANVQTDAARKQNTFLAETLVKLVAFLENAPDVAAERSRVNVYRRHFESSCGIPSTVKDTRAEPKAPQSGTTNGTRPSFESKASSSSLASASTTGTTTTTPTTTSTATGAPSSKIPPSSLLEYQPKSFLQPKDPQAKDEDMAEFIEDEDEAMLIDEEVITNVTQPALSASLDHKIKSYGHEMHYSQRSNCRFCRRMTSKRCEHCNYCVKCAQKDRCNPTEVPPGAPPKVRPSLSVSDRNVQVLGKAMDEAVYKAFKSEDFYGVFSLVQNGMDVNFQRIESDGSTALMAAAHHGREDAANKLLSLGANPCLVDSSGSMAWAFARRRGHGELADKLKQAADEWKA